MTASRAVAFRGFADGLRSGYDQTVPGLGEAGYRVLIGAATVEPFGQLAALRVGTDGVREGGGAAALLSFARTHEVGFTTLGVRAEARLGMDTPLVARGLDSGLAPRLRRHDADGALRLRRRRAGRS